LYLQADEKAIKKELLDIIENSRRKVTPGELEKALSRKYSLEKNKPVRISKHVILKPPGFYYKPKADDVVIEIGQGVSFGNGQHPTTRLAIRGIEYALNKTNLLKAKEKTSVLDIGTGSGVLGITALMMGIKDAVGVDIDPCSIKEAGDNAKINKLEDKFVIKNMSLEDLNTEFTLITANLRYPTLMNIYHRLVKMTEPGGAVVLSGIKSDEAISVVDLYTEKYFECKWEEFEKGWAGLVFLKTTEEYRSV